MVHLLKMSVVCDGSGPAENFDCDGNCLVEVDCAGVCNGSSVEDECGVCDGSGPAENFDCDNCLVEVDCAGEVWRKCCL